MIIDIADEMEKAGLSPEAMNIELTESDLLEGDIVRNIQVNIRMYDGWDE